MNGDDQAINAFVDVSLCPVVGLAISRGRPVVKYCIALITVILTLYCVYIFVF